MIDIYANDTTGVRTSIFDIMLCGEFKKTVLIILKLIYRKDKDGKSLPSKCSAPPLYDQYYEDIEKVVQAWVDNDLYTDDHRNTIVAKLEGYLNCKDDANKEEKKHKFIEGVTKLLKGRTGDHVASYQYNEFPKRKADQSDEERVRDLMADKVRLKPHTQNIKLKTIYDEVVRELKTLKKGNPGAFKAQRGTTLLCYKERVITSWISRQKRKKWT